MIEEGGPAPEVTEPPAHRVVNIFTRAPVQATVKTDEETGEKTVAIVDAESLRLAKHVVEMVESGTLTGLAICGVNLETMVPIVAAVDSLPRLFQKTVLLFGLEMLREGITDSVHDNLQWRDVEGEVVESDEGDDDDDDLDPAS